MKIIHKKDSITAKRGGENINYYLRNEYELIYVIQEPNTTQTWHHHDIVFETIFILEGEMVVKWRDNGKEFSEKLFAGSMIEVEKNPHVLINESPSAVRLLAIKQILSGENKREIFKNDKVIDE